MTTSYGHVIGTKRIVQHGSPSLRWNMVILGDGYRDTKREMSKYHKDARNFARRLHTAPPFKKLWRKINIYRVDVASKDSGADDPSRGIIARTYFNASFGGSGLQRLLVVNTRKALKTARHEVPWHHVVVVIVNSAIFGGSGGAGGVAAFSTPRVKKDVGLHELGHSAFALADEYQYYSGCDGNMSRDTKFHGREPAEANITIQKSRAKLRKKKPSWDRLLTPGTSLPSTKNTDCSKCDRRPNRLPPKTVGTFEGANHKHCGIFRPQFNCRMRKLGKQFCAVCQAAIIRTLEPYTAA